MVNIFFYIRFCCKDNINNRYNKHLLLFFLFKTHLLFVIQIINDSKFMSVVTIIMSLMNKLILNMLLRPRKTTTSGFPNFIIE